MAHEIDDVSRRLVIERAGRRCEYCLIHEESVGFPHQIDHIVSRKHGGSSGIGNLAYACVLCNRYKGTDVASLDSSGQPVRFFDPRRDIWDEHFKLNGAVITEVEPASFAEDVGFARGDVIIEINHTPVLSLADYHTQMSRLKPGEDVLFRIARHSDNGSLMLYLAGTVPPQ